MSYIGSKPASKPVVASDLDPAVITGQTALAVAPADTDEFLISDAGTLKRLDASLIGGGGKVLQVVSNTTTTVASTTSSTYEHATNCPTLNITPAASSSKILLIASIGAVETNGTGYFTMFRDSTNLGGSGEGFGYIQPDNTTYLGGGHHVLDEPSTSSQITYQIRIKCSGGTFTIGRSESRASLTAIEIGA